MEVRRAGRGFGKSTDLENPVIGFSAEHDRPGDLAIEVWRTKLGALGCNVYR
jgi:hypothetical protein